MPEQKNYGQYVEPGAEFLAGTLLSLALQPDAYNAP